MILNDIIYIDYNIYIERESIFDNYYSMSVNLEFISIIKCVQAHSA